MPPLEDIEKQAAKLLGFTPQTIGKTQARKEFFPLVDGLGKSAVAVEITDHEKPVAVLLSYPNYMALLTKVCMLSKIQSLNSAPDLIGSISIQSQDLDTASSEIGTRFKQALKDSADKL